ncbi:MAG: serine/threonine protein kinase [Polyangiaceae bacterium]|jgi:serine/threonine-protein kinase|nr:serine/threonine protein kinase [Polyangiaceae bacterium]
MTQPVQEGELLAGKYKVERVLGQGGMGVVVAATHQQLDQRVALKFLLPHGAGDADSVARFLREARAAVRLRSEHVAKVLDVGTLESGAPFIVMEYLDGRDLSAMIEGGPLPVGEAIEYVLQACEALAEAHAAGIVHRDLKPDNLFLTRRSDGSPCIKVLDFGISKMADPNGSATKTSSLMGTPLYMSPEQLRSSKKVDARSDIWSLGMILYELLTGQVAFTRDTLPELCAAILMDPLVPPRELRPSIPEQVDAIICRCLEKEPDRRFPSLRELTQALAPMTEGGPAVARRVERTLGVMNTAVLPSAPAIPPPTPSPSRLNAETLAPSALAETQGPQSSTPRASELVALLRTAAAPPAAPSAPEPVPSAPEPVPSAPELSASAAEPVSSPAPRPASRAAWLAAPALALLVGIGLWRTSASPEAVPQPPPPASPASVALPEATPPREVAPPPAAPPPSAEPPPAAMTAAAAATAATAALPPAPPPRKTTVKAQGAPPRPPSTKPVDFGGRY